MKINWDNLITKKGTLISILPRFALVILTPSEFYDICTALLRNRRFGSLLRNSLKHEMNLYIKSSNSLPHNPNFYRPLERSHLKTLWEKEKMLETSIFSISHSFLFCTLCKTNFNFFSQILLVVCICFQFEPVLKFVIW